MIGQTISHYKTLEKLGEVPTFPMIATDVGRVVGMLSIPPSVGGSYGGSVA